MFFNVIFIYYVLCILLILFFIFYFFVCDSRVYNLGSLKIDPE